VGSDPEVKRSKFPAFTRGNAASAAVLGILLGLGIALRLARISAGDYYEDGATHWWAAARSVHTGDLVDPFDLNTLGYWLPGYDRVAASFFFASGTTALDALRVLGIGFFVAAAIALFALAAPAGRGVGFLSVGLFAVSPWDILNAPITTALEPAVAFLMIGLVFFNRSRAGNQLDIYGAALFFGLAALFRYEALPFVGVILVFNWWWSGGRPLSRYLRVWQGPLLWSVLLLGAVVMVATWGYNFPSKVLAGGPPELALDGTLGLVAHDPVGRNMDFWGFWVAGAPVVVALAVVGGVAHFRRVETWLVGAFAFLMAVFIFFNVGPASVRYLLPVEPLVCFLAALGVRQIMRPITRGMARTTGLGRSSGPKAMAFALVGLLVLSSAAASSEHALDPIDSRIILHGPLYRAAAFVVAQPQDETQLILIDSPLAAEASGIPPERLIGSAELPRTRDAATAFMVSRVQYVVAVTLPYYPLMTLFPELGRGVPSSTFSLIYNATGWESAYTIKTAYVYRVNHGSGLLQFSTDLALAFAWHGSDANGTISGMQLLSKGENISAPEEGIGYPTLSTSLGNYAPIALDTQFKKNTTPPEVLANFTLYPTLPDGTLDPAQPKAVVMADFRQGVDSVEASFTVRPPAGATWFILRVNNSLPASNFPFSMNDSSASPDGAPAEEAMVFSLDNWIIGPRATFQADFRDPALMFAGRTQNGTAWLAYDAPVNATSISFLFHIIPPGVDLYGRDEPTLYKAPLFRAGGFLKTAPRNASMRILSDFAFGAYQWVLEASGRPGYEFASSSELPLERASGLAWLRDHIEYIVAVNRTGDPVTSLFPELASGQSTQNFSAMIDASGPPGSLTQNTVWVYRVNRDEGAVPAHPGSFLTFKFLEDAGTGQAEGFGLTVGSEELIHPSAGLGVPAALVNGTAYRATRAQLDFATGSAGKSVEGRFWLYPWANGSADLSVPALEVQATYSYGDLLLNMSLVAWPASSDDNVTLSALAVLPSRAFPVYLNDTDWNATASSAARDNVWGIRNWLLGPSATIQVDFADPLLLYYARTPGGDVVLEYQAAEGLRDLHASIWILPPELGPPL
jgi:hypothetical protein